MIELIAGSVCKMPTVGKVTRDILLRSYNYCCNRLNGCCSYLMQEEDESGTEYKCAYYGNSRCKDGMLDDAIEFLKEQKIKSMTLEELDEIYEKQDTHIWPFDTPPYLWMTVNPDVRLTDGFWICWRDIMYSIKNESPFYVRENYGKAWLIWTGKPTQEQVQAVKWDG